MDFKEQYIKEKGYSKFNKYNENDYTKFLEKKLIETNQAPQPANKCQCKRSIFTRTVDADFNPLCGKCGEKVEKPINKLNK